MAMVAFCLRVCPHKRTSKKHFTISRQYVSEIQIHQLLFHNSLRMKTCILPDFSRVAIYPEEDCYGCNEAFDKQLWENKGEPAKPHVARNDNFLFPGQL